MAGLGGEIGMKLQRAAFAVIIQLCNWEGKIASLVSDENFIENGDQLVAALDIDHSDLVDQWIRAGEMRKWYLQEKQNCE